MSKHSIRSGSDSRLRTSRSSSSASTRRSRFVSATSVSEESASSALRWASSCSRRFSPRSGARSSTREPRTSLRKPWSVVELAEPARHEDLRRQRGRGAVVLDAEALEHLERIGAGSVLELERVAVDHPPFAEREHLHGGALAADREPDHVDRADRSALDRLPFGKPLDRVQPVAVARRVFEPLRHAAASRICRPSSARIGRSLPDRNSTTPSITSR